MKILLVSIAWNIRYDSLEKISQNSAFFHYLFDPSKEHYQKFDMVYGKPPSEKDRPSYVAQEAKDNDKKSASMLVSGNVRACIQCGECHKARCVYSQCRLNLQELNEITRIKESDIYTMSCGSILFPPGSKHEKSIIVRGSH